MRVRATTVFFFSVVAILALTSQGVPVAQQDTPGQDTPRGKPRPDAAAAADAVGSGTLAGGTGLRSAGSVAAE